MGDEGEDAFEGIDESGDGLLDLDEIGSIFLRNGVYLTEDELVVVFNAIDDDGSGEVDLDEFMSWLRGTTQMAAKLRNKMSVDGNKNTEDEDDALDENDPLGSTKRKLRKLAEVLTLPPCRRLRVQLYCAISIDTATHAYLCALQQYSDGFTACNLTSGPWAIHAPPV